MTYSTDSHTDETTEEMLTYASYMGNVFLVFAVVWLLGAGLMFTAAFVGSGLGHTPAVTAPATAAPAASPAPATTP